MASDGVAALGLACVVLLAPWLLLRFAAARRLAPVDVVAAPGVSVLVLATAGMVLARWGRATSPASVTVLLVAAAAVAAAASLLVRHRRRRAGRTPPPRKPVARAELRGILVAAGGAGFAAALGVSIWWSTTWLTGVPQFVDGIWHGYVTALLAAGAPADPVSLVPLDPLLAAPTTPYPYGFHLIASLLVPSSDAAAAMDGVAVAGVLLVGPLGAAGAARVLAPRLPVAALLAPVLLQAVALWQVAVQGIPPYALGMALLPGGLALVVRAAGSGWRTGPLCLATAYGAGMLVVQPAAAVSLAVLSLPLLVLSAVRRARLRRRPRLRGVQRRWPVLLVLALTTPWVVRSLTSAELAFAVPRKVREPLVPSLVHTLTLGADRGVTSAVVAVLVASGLLALAVLGPVRWVIVSWALAVGLAVVAAGGNGGLRRWTTPWFMDAHRLTSMVAVIATVAAACGLASLLDRLGRLPAVESARARRVVVAATAVVVAGALVVGIAVTLPAQRELTSRSRGDKLVTPGERAAFSWLSGALRPGERVMNYWRDGSTWSYSLDGVPVLLPYLSTLSGIPERGWAFYNMTRLGTDARLDADLVDWGARYALVDDTAIPAPRPPTWWFPVSSPYATVVFSSGGTRVYRLDLEALAARSVAQPAGSTSPSR